MTDPIIDSNQIPKDSVYFSPQISKATYAGRGWRWLKEKVSEFIYQIFQLIAFLFQIQIEKPNKKTPPTQPPGQGQTHPVPPLQNLPQISTEQEEDDPFTTSDLPPIPPIADRTSTTPSPVSSQEPSPKSTISSKSNSPTKVSPTQAPKAIITTPLFSQKLPRIQDVPDKGNCLFCSLGVGLKRLGWNKHSIASWNVDITKLNGNLVANEKQLQLEEIAKKLRGEAYQILSKIEKFKLAPEEFYKKYPNDPDDGIYNDIWINQIKSFDDTVSYGIGLKKQRLNSFEKQRKEVSLKNKEEIAQLDKWIADKKSEIAKEEKRLLKNFDGLLAAMKADSFHCGPAQAYAISQLYDVPIVIWGATPFKPDSKPIVLQNITLAPILVEEGIYWNPVVIGAQCKGPIVHILHQARKSHFQLLSET